MDADERSKQVNASKTFNVLAKYKIEDEDETE